MSGKRGGVAVTRRRAAAVCASSLLALWTASASPALAGGRNVLVLDTGMPGRPFGVAIASALREQLVALSPEPPSIFEEGLDLERFSGEEHAARLRQFLADKYRERPPQLVVALGDPAVRFVLGWTDAPWTTPAIVFGAAGQDTATAALATGRATGLLVRLDVDASLSAALALVPDADEVVLVASGDPYLPLTEAALARLAGRVRVTRLVELSLEEIKARIAGLSPRAFVYFTNLTVDSQGRGLTGRQALAALADVSSRPVFSHTGTLLGHGIVGGSLVDATVIGRELGELTGRVLAGEAPASIPLAESRSSRLQFDARQLERWGLDERRLPPGSEVLFRRPTLLEEHRDTVLTAAVLLLVQAGLIVALTVAVRRRRAAQQQLRELSGRILTAQEEERGRIARELHDGASQQLALLAIELDELGAGDGPSQARSLAGRARVLSRELHHIAYELHPAILDQLGLVPALRQFADQLSARGGLKVEVVESDWPAELAPDVALALYRIGQEALQNVARHSAARDARVTLRGSERGVTLMVSDEGRGFDPAGVAGGSLGLAGMRERLRLVGGELCVDSAPGRGATIAAAVPSRALAASAAAARQPAERIDEEAASPAR
jgi:signal transduction histidine kinase